MFLEGRRVDLPRFGSRDPLRETSRAPVEKAAQPPGLGEAAPEPGRLTKKSGAFSKPPGPK